MLVQDERRARLASRHVLAGGGEMGALMRSIDWSKTAVGPVEGWPQSLRTALSILLETGFAMYIAWGKDFTQFYNDGYRPILGSTKHPAAMGISTRETFAEIWHIIGPMFEGVMRGTPVTVRDFLLPLDRHGFVEECYFDFSYSPIREETGVVGGVLVTVSETTARVLGARRLETLRALAAQTQKAETARAACALSAEVLGRNAADLPFSLLYLIDGDDVELAAAAHVEDGASLADPARWPIADVARDGAARVVDVEGSDQARRAYVVPVRAPGESRASGVLVAALGSRLLLDDAYKSFLGLVAGQIGTGVGAALAFEEAKARAAALAEIDRAKTTFFSNVSHEFRTPLTLMLGPIEDALVQREGVLPRDGLELVQRNGLRLLKLVNSLLDFARIEAGRVQASYEPTDLAALTIDLASAFRSAVERAGLSFDVRCDAPADPEPGQAHEPIYVDHDMWEKIVLNLLSNALKFTFEGAISVRLRWLPGAAELTVRDTGVGIPAAELPRVFERFHRVEGSRSRTHEGSGIGLALSQELARLHGGEIRVASEAGRGTTFTVTIPAGTKHLPKDRIAAPKANATTATGAAPFVEEALRWLPDGSDPSSNLGLGLGLASVAVAGGPPSAERTAAGTILVADDNADMREYVRRILSARWHVETAHDGAEALAVARDKRPDLVVADVMMPNLDGFGLLRALRAEPTTQRIPVIMLSARAGEEARVDGLEAGADDYLVKPFVARELVARVESQLAHARVRQLEEERARHLTTIFQNAPVGIAILRGPTHIYDFANADYMRLVGDRDVLGKPIREALPELAGQGIFELLDEVIATGRPFRAPSIRAVLHRKAGGEPDEGFFNLVYQPLLEDDGRASGIVVVATEVTELARARRDAEAANRAKDEFLAILGHELRNPLAPIQTALQLMKLKSGDASERERTVIARQVKHLTRLVDDLLDVPRLTSGKIALAKERIEIADVIAKAIEMASPLIEQRGHELIVEVAREGLEIDGDPTRLAQVFANIITNAAKYTDPGGHIHVTARLDAAPRPNSARAESARDRERALEHARTREHAGEDDRVVVEISDDGIGIPPEILPRVFEVFVQERQGLDRSLGGLGLGLSIVRSLVELHGGQVTAHSDGPRRGSRFTVRLPAIDTRASDPGHIPAATPSAPRVASAGRVLVVDDNRDAAELLTVYLETLGYEVATAHDGPTALDLVDAFSPELALLDVGLPVMNGYELAAKLKERPALSATRLVAVTGYGQESDKQRSQAAGFDAHVVKPLDLDALTALLNRLMSGRG